MCSVQAEGQVVKLLVDTGVRGSYFGNDQLARLKLKPHDMMPKQLTSHVFGAETTSRVPQIATVSALEIGGVKLTEVEFGISGLSGWGIAQEKKSLPEVHGVLGTELLTSCSAIIDFQQRKLWVRAGVGKK